MLGDTTEQQTSRAPLVLLAIVGTGDYQPVRYSLDGLISNPTRYAPVAALDLLAQAGQPVSHVRALLTSEAADKHLAELQAEVATQSPESILEPVLIPQGQDEAELWAIFESVYSAAADSLAMDVTHGFRSTPLVAVSALRFISETDGLAAPRIFYGAWEARNAQNVAPMFDLSVIMHMDRWARAIRDLEQDLDPRALTALVEERRREIRPQGNDPQQLRQLGAAIRAGLPLEAGLAAASLQRSRLADKLCNIAPPAARLAGSLDRTIADLLVSAHHSRKARIALDEVELDRQRRVIDHALSVFDMGTAYRLAREWVVNRVLLVSGHAASWLERSVRTSAEGALRNVYLQSRSSEAAPLSHLFDLRNSLSHGGFQTGELRPEQMAGDFRKAWEDVQAMADSSFALMPAELSPPLTLAVSFCDSASAEAQAILQHAALRNPQARVKFASVARRENEAASAFTDFCHTRALELERELALSERCTVLVQMGGMSPVDEAVAHELSSVLKHHGHHVVRLLPLGPRSPDVVTTSATSSCLELDDC